MACWRQCRPWMLPNCITRPFFLSFMIFLRQANIISPQAALAMLAGVHVHTVCQSMIDVLMDKNRIAVTVISFPGICGAVVTCWPYITSVYCMLLSSYITGQAPGVALVYDGLWVCVQYIPRIMYMVHAWLCLVVVGYWASLVISFRVASQALGQSYDCPSASEATLRNIGIYIMNP